MEIVFAIAVFWFFVTVLGHGTWLLVAAIVRALLGQRNDRSSQPRADGTTLVRPVSSDPAVVKEAEITTRAEAEPALVMATLVDEHEVVDAQPIGPTLSRSEMVTSFLAARNIRWGELVAGMLIVISSIGLVISLWSPLLQTHRVAPSLIFLTANASIFAAGFYTLSRWRLRHTSRAILIIASLLVPLSVLAGLAAASSGGDSIADSVRLNDPVTLVSLAIATAVYAWLLLHAGRALVGRGGAWSFMTSIAGPVVLLPLIPTTIRWLGSSAGWTIGLASLATFLAWNVYGHHRRRHKGDGFSIGQLGFRTISRAASRNHFILLAVNLFASLVTAGYFAFVSRQDITLVWPMLVGGLPLLLISAGATMRLAELARPAGQALAAKIAGVLLIALALAPLVVFSSVDAWLLGYAVVFAATCGLMAYQHRLANWVSLATAPLGFACIWTWPTWMGYENAEAAGALVRLVSGPSLLVSLGLAAMIAAWARLVRGQQITAACWIGVCVLISAALSTLPTALLGFCPFGLPVVVLASAAALLLWNPLRLPAPMHTVAVGLLGMAVVAAFRPLTLAWSDQGFVPIFAGEEVWLWALTTLAIAASAIAWFGQWKGLWKAEPRGQRIWRASAAISVTATSVLAWFVFEESVANASIAWSIAAGLLFATSVIFRDVQALALSQAITLAAGFRWASHAWHDLMFEGAAWESGAAVWYWIGCFAGFAVTWLLVETTLRRWWAFDVRNFSLARWAGRIASVGFIAMIAVMWVEVLADSFGHSIQFKFAATTPVRLSIAALAGWISFEIDRERRWSSLSKVVVMAMSAWLAGLLAVASGLVASGHLFDVVTVTTWITVMAWVFFIAHQDSPRSLGKASVPIALWTVAAVLIAASLPELMVTQVVGWGSLITGGVWVGWMQRHSLSAWHRIGLRSSGWFVVIAGSCWVGDWLESNASVTWVITAMLGWVTIWVVIWRTGSSRDASRSSTPATEFSVIVLLALITEFCITLMQGIDAYPDGILGHALMMRCLIYALAVASCVLGVIRSRSASPSNLGIGLITLLVLAGLVAVQASLNWDASVLTRGAIAAMTIGTLAGLAGMQFPTVHRLVQRLEQRFVGKREMASGHETARIIAAVSLLVSFAILAWFVGMLTEFGSVPADGPTLILTVLSLSPIAWGLAVLGEWSGSDRFRTLAISVGLIMVGLIASVSLSPTKLTWLVGAMRLWVGSIASMVILWSVAPKLLGQRMADRWAVAMRRGLVASGVTAMASLAAMFVFEFAAFRNGDAGALSLVHKLGGAITIAGVSLFAAWVAISAGQRGKDASPRLSGPLRSGLLIASQVLMGLVCLHLTLCKAQWAILGLRHYWPFTVMVVAGLSVAATEWLHRSGDDVLAKTMKQTSLYLPMVPVIGFWLGSWTSPESWNLIGSVIQYEWILVLGAIYYLATSVIWKSDSTRVVSIVLGNAAFWVLLGQTPGWGFLAHPQLWLIPPAVCVLVLSHFHGERLPDSLRSAVRYGATLVIYISSTADVMFDSLGQSLAAPMILITFAIAGMVAGIILRVRPFLYLGATFVFVGVTSMVWHAGRSFDAVWPWWVFGIGSGIVILGCLTAIEKNKPKLRAYAKQLATWQ